jgi:hypothetical protein
VVVRRDIGVLARLDVVALVAYAGTRSDAAAWSIVLVTVLVAWPLTIVVPMRWRGELEESDAIRCGTLFLGASLGIFVVAYGDAQDASYPSTALLLGFAAAHMLLVWLYLHPRVSDIRAFPAWVGGSVLFIAGMLADLPHPLGWNSLAFGLYGLASGAAIHRLHLFDSPPRPDSPPGCRTVDA